MNTRRVPKPSNTANVVAFLNFGGLGKDELIDTIKSEQTRVY